MQVGSVTFGGLVSGLDVNALVDAIINAESQPLERLRERRSLFDAKRTALEEIRAGLSTFRFALQDLATFKNLGGRTAFAGNEAVVRATPSASAQRGSFDVGVTALAQAHRVKSNAVADRLEPLVTDGTITLQSGGNDLITVDVSASTGNNTLSAVRDAINAAAAGVNASIVNDGTGDILVVRSEETGTAQSLTITDSTNLNLNGGANLIQAAADANLTVDGIAITSGSNKVVNAYDGVVLDLTGVGTTSVTVESDTETVKTSLQAFAEEYNKVVELLATHTINGVDDTGVLAGDSTARRIQATLASLVASGVEGLPDGSLRSLGSLGFDLDGRSGQISLNAGKLDDILETRFDDVRQVFLSLTSATDAAVQIQSSAFEGNGPFALQITSAAEQAQVLGSTVIDKLGNDENLTITVGTDVVNVALEKNDQIAAIVTKINDALVAAGVEARAQDQGGKLAIATDAYGLAAVIEVVSDSNDSGNGKSTGIGTTAVNDTGVDVAGTINGEAATGLGQILSAGEGTVAEGLAVRILADAAGVSARGGDFGTVSTSAGLRDTIVDRVKLFSDPFTGTIHTVTSGIEGSIRSLDIEEETKELRLAERRNFLILQFGKAERALSQLQSSQVSALLGSG